MAITAYDSATGTVSYTYTLNDNEAHASGLGTNSLFEDLAVLLTDRDGDNTPSTLSVNIVDDVPTAVADSNVGTASETNLTLSGNLISNDTQGADGAAVVGASLSGTYGSIVIGTDGSYTYTLNAADADFVALVGGATATETFSYTLRDADGDESTAQLTLNIRNDDDSVTITDLTPKADGGDVSVNEDDLLASRSSGESAGSDASKESTTQGGTFTISAPDGVQSLTVGGLNVITNGVFAAVNGSTPLGNTLSITAYDALTGTVTYTYTLNDNEAHASGLGTNSLFEDLAVLLTDRDGDNTPSTLSVNIVDDVDTAINNTATLVENTGKTDVVLIFDTSGSMLGARLADAKAAVANLLSSGTVNSVFIVDFNSDADFSNSGSNGGWYTNLGSGSGGALNVINGFVADGSTDYDSALRVVKANFTNPPPGGDRLVSIFLSDGEPNQTDGTDTVGIIESDTNNPGFGGIGEESHWINFLKDNGFDESFAIGFGELSDTDKNFLEPIAWTSTVGSTTTVETAGTYTGTNAGANDPNVIIANSNASAITDALLVATTPISGDLLADDIPGADGPLTLVSVTYGASTVTFSPSTTSATFNVTDASSQAVGTVVIFANGTYSFTAAANVDVANTRFATPITYAVKDGDGDVSTATLTVNITDTSEVVAYDNFNGSARALPSTSIVTTTLSDFSSAVSIVDDADNSLATAIANTSNLNKWIASSISLTTVDASIASGSLRLEDNDDDGSGVARLIAPVFTISTANSTLSFDYDRGNVNSGDNVSWTLYKFVGSSWTAQSGVGFTGNLNSDPGPPSTITTGALSTGDYRIVFSNQDGGESSDSQLFIDNLNIKFTVPSVQVIATTGNVITNPNTLIGSSDPANAVDSRGSEGASLSIFNGSSYVAATSAGDTVNGSHGSLLIKDDGTYTYTPNSVLSNTLRTDEFTYKLTHPDGDNDTAKLVVEIPASITPVALDLNGDGIDWLQLNEGAKFDYGAGLVATAWVGSNDGLLAYDYNQDGLINEAKEIVFTTWAPHMASDLQALQAYFDSNYDNVLSQLDAGWSKFGVWIDSNSDGVNQPGEFIYLKEAGIESINLTYDHTSSPSVVAEGDVSILGTSTFTWDAAHGGGTGTAADVAFAAAPVDAPVADTSVPAADTFIQDVAIPDEQVVEAEVASVADLVAQYVGENAVTDEAMAVYQQELALTELPAAADLAADPAGIEPTADALAALDEVDALLPDDASDGIATATDVVDDFSYAV
ncbi:Ig-like domain-containing protein [Cyanobium sp. BA5m-10]|uniref:Ig-like domain-containing protein n=1 Tax=Cyanobium sp. BA5m-10 TaxID=2823705 RepID=UPI0020CE8EA8|nr:Ig-like domain-containing protein [Cyanobium sp. BA5m-10]